MVNIVKTVSLFACGSLIAGSVAMARTADAAPRHVPATSAFWSALGNIEFERGQGAQPGLLRVNSGAAALRGAPFSDGTIEFDVEDLADGDGMDFPSVRFRQRDQGTAEQLYLRPHDGCITSNDCIQYAPVVHDTLMWDIYPEYQSGGPIQASGWNHLKLVIAGHRLEAFVNRASTPTLVIDHLAGDAASGGIQLNGPALYRDIQVTPGMPAILSNTPTPHDPAGAGRLLLGWQLSEQSFVAPGPMPNYADMPASSRWVDIRAEQFGLINLTRRFEAAPRAVGALAWLKTTIISDRDQTKRVSIGWTREVRVFANGRPVFADKNYYYGLQATRRPPSGLLSLENGSFDLPLHRGSNEIAIALNNFFPGSAVHSGWGMKLQIHDLDGIRLTE